MPSYNLYIDESGVPEHTHPDKNYTLCGIISTNQQSQDLKIKADQIKFKYWNTTNIVFHSVDIGRKKKDFSILRTDSINENFLDDLMLFLNNGEFLCVCVSIDKKKALAAGWQANRILDYANDRMIGTFIEFLHQRDSRGRILIESSSAKDIAFYKRYTAYLSHGYKKLGLNGGDLKKMLTAVSFVSKNNYDIEAQLADLFAYPSTYKFLHDEGIKEIVSGSYEERICNIVDAKFAIVAGTKSIFRLP